MSEDVLTVAFSPDGRSLVSSGHEAGIHWWNPQTAERVRLQGGHGVAVHELCFSKDGQLLASAGGDGTARLWDGASGAPVRTLAVGAVTYAVALSPDARFAATGSFDGLVRLWDVKDGRLLVTLLSCAGPGDQAAWVALTPEGYAQAGGAVTPAWRVNGQAAPDALGKDLAQPALVARALRGEPLPPAK
jgi:WD40 repeat protein